MLETVEEILRRNQPEPINYIKPGTICEFEDWIDPDLKILCTVKHVEPDEQIRGVLYYYLMANDEELNNKVDPRFPWSFFEILPVGSTRLRPIAQATMS